MRTAIISLITLYQRTLSPDHGPLRRLFPHGVCRFHPTCSEYMKQAVRSHGVRRGVAMGARRLSRCHPAADGGLDPVPKH